MLPYGTFAIFQFTWFYFLRCFLFLFKSVFVIWRGDAVFLLFYNQIESTMSARIYLLKVNNGNTRTMCEIYPKLTIRTPEWRQWRHSGVVIDNFEQILHFFSSWNAIAYSKLHAKLLVHVQNNMLNSFKVNNVEAVTRGVL